jgi:hypothetical protein
MDAQNCSDKTGKRTPNINYESQRSYIEDLFATKLALLLQLLSLVDTPEKDVEIYLSNIVTKKIYPLFSFSQ